MRAEMFLFLIFSISSFESYAQQTNQLSRQNAPIYAKKSVDTLTKKLSLTKQQILLLDTLERDYLDKRAAIPSQVPIEQRKFIMAEQDQWHKKRLAAILTPAQLKLYEELMLNKKQQVEKKRQQLIEQKKSKNG
jgi:hypothetical protein